MTNIDYISIDKSLIPYAFDITLEEETYTFEVNYNNANDFFTINLLKNSVIIVLGEKLVYAKPLFLSAVHKDIPWPTIIPFDLSENTERITFENLSESVFLYILEGEVQ